MSALMLEAETFELSARTNLQSAANSLERAATRYDEIGAAVLAASERSAAATIREILELDAGSYFVLAGPRDA